MTVTEELLAIADSLAVLKTKFVESKMGNFLESEDESEAEGLVAEARAIIQDALGYGNDFTMRLISVVSSGSGGFMGGFSQQCIGDVEALVRRAVRQIHR